jgi:hypothetical protein
MKFKTKKQKLFTITSVAAILFLSLVSAGSLVPVSPLITGLSRWAIMIFPFFLQSNTCRCS